MSEFFFCSNLNSIDKNSWNNCIGNDHPFLQHEFLNALEKSGSASIKTGWKPHHYIEKDKQEIIAICPLYIKNHSFGEYIFDHAWADWSHCLYGRNYAC